MTSKSALVLTLVVALVASAAAEPPCGDLATYPVRFAIMGDRTGSHQEGVFGVCVEEVARLRPDFVMTVGDMIEGYTSDTVRMQQEWDEYFTLLEPLEMPIYHTPGNHDITSDEMEPTFRTRVGKPNYSFDHRGIHIVVFDNSRMESWDDMPDEQLDWLRSDLETNAGACYTLVFFHKPFWYRTLGDGHSDALHEIFKANGVDAVFTGHFHKYFSADFDGVLYTSIGSSGAGTEESPTGLMYHFGWVTIDGSGIHIAPIKKDAVLPWDYQSVGELRASYVAQDEGMRFPQPLMVDEGSSPGDATITVALKNESPVPEYADTLRWDVPDSWTVEPEVLPFALHGDEAITVPFTVRFTDALYPLPSLSTFLPYSEGKTIRVSRSLEIARTVTCAPADDRITIDGRLTESCWQKPLSDLFDYDGLRSERDSTAVSFAYDNDNLYLAVYCHESVMDSLAANLTERDADVFTEDAFGLLFQASPPDGDVYQVYVNPLGTVYDQHIEQQTDGYWTAEPSWNGEYEVQTSRLDDGYALELRIPIGQFGGTLKPGDEWRVNFRRKQRHTNMAYALQVPWAYDPASFGVLEFK